MSGQEQAEEGRTMDGKGIKLCIIGYGGMGEYHAMRLREGGWHNLAAYDINAERSALAAAQGLQVYSSAEEAAQDVTLQAVIIATPNDLHRCYTEQFSAAKKHILCEKPATLTAKDFEAMSAAARRNNVHLLVHQNRRWDRDYLMVRKLLDSSAAGQCYRLESRVMGSNGIPGGWRKKAAQGGGMMMDWGVHLIDQILTLNTTKITSIYCEMSYALGFEVDDGFRLTLNFEDGFTAFLEVDTNCFTPLPRWVIYGKEGSAVIDSWDKDARLVKPSGDITEGMIAGNGFTKTMAHRTADNKLECFIPLPPPDRQFLYRHFCDIINNNDEMLILHSEVHRVLRVMEYAFQSAKTNTVIIPQE